MKIVAALSVCLLAPASLAGFKPHVGDIGVSFVDGRIVTSIVEEEDHARGGLGVPERVFASELGSVEYGPFGNDEPGYTSNVLPAGARIGFDILAELRRWNGAGFEGAIDETMQLARFLGTPGEEAVATSNGFVPGFHFAEADSGGFIDEHLSHVLRGPDALRGFADPADGIYLLELGLFTDAPGIAASDPYWIVFNLNSPEADHDAAIDFVRDNLVPAPGAAGLLICLVALHPRRRAASPRRNV